MKAEKYNGNLHSEAFNYVYKKDNKIDVSDIKINPKGLPEGENNKFIS